jgi:carboxylesterase type B
VFDSIAPLDEIDLYDPELPAVRHVADLWSSTLASFARHGHPNHQRPEWPHYLPGQACLLVDDPLTLGHDVDAVRQRRWGDRDTQ